MHKINNWWGCYSYVTYGWDDIFLDFHNFYVSAYILSWISKSDHYKKLTNPSRILHHKTNSTETSESSSMTSSSSTKTLLLFILMVIAMYSNASVVPRRIAHSANVIKKRFERKSKKIEEWDIELSTNRVNCRLRGVLCSKLIVENHNVHSQSLFFFWHCFGIKANLSCTSETMFIVPVCCIESVLEYPMFLEEFKCQEQCFVKMYLLADKVNTLELTSARSCWSHDLAMTNRIIRRVQCLTLWSNEIFYK